MRLLAESQHLGADGVHGRRHDGAHRGVARDAPDDDLVAQVDVGDDAEPFGAAHEDGRPPLVDHQLGGLSDGGAEVAEDGRTAHDLRDRARAHVGQRAHRARCLKQALAVVGRQPLDAFRAAQQLDGDVFGDAVDP
jgi:hypothetical protein